MLCVGLQRGPQLTPDFHLGTSGVPSLLQLSVFHAAEQGLSASALWMCWVRRLCVGAVLCPVECSAASLASPHLMPMGPMSSQLRQPKLSPGIADVPWRGVATRALVCHTGLSHTLSGPWGQEAWQALPCCSHCLKDPVPSLSSASQLPLRHLAVNVESECVFSKCSHEVNRFHTSTPTTDNQKV